MTRTLFCLFFLFAGFGVAHSQTLECTGAIVLEDEVPYDGTTVGGTSTVSQYSCADWDESGPEQVHVITTTIAGDIRATISNVADGEDLDVFILNACDPLQCVGHGDGTAIYANAPPGTYFIVVDGYDGASSSYTLTIDIPNTPFSCTEAVELEGGVPYEGSTVGALSLISQYSCAADWDESGPEQVHIITTTITGDIVARISNVSANGDLDVFILSACDPLQCVGYEADVNNSTRYANAPPGTYFIIVDGYFGASGSYSLTVDIPDEPFSCTEAIELEDEVPYDGTTEAASSLVSFYSCIDWDETGPEQVHVIRTTNTGDITATLSDLPDDQDLDVFILSACDPLSCVAAGDETAVYENAPPGMYFIVIDGYQGASGTYTLTVNIPACEISFSDVLPEFWAEKYITAIYCKGITSGYSDGTYRPSQNVQRSQMAAFIIRAKYGESFTYSATPYFTDVPSGHWAFKYVQKMYEDQITTGYPDGTYRPAGNVTRGQMAAFIIRGLYGESFTYNETPYFTDVPASHGAFKYVQKVFEEGIASGYSDGTYRPSQNVNRAQMAAFIAKAFLGMP
jgi:hypothetical protein